MDFDISTDSNLSSNLIEDIPIIDATKLTYHDFFQNYILRNAPCVIKNITDHWESSLFWLKDDKPNFDYLLNKYSQCKVTVYNCSERYYNSQKTNESSFSDYINYWKHVDDSSSTLGKLNYLKDWHLKLNNKDDNFYEVPIYFASDWLNEYYTECLNDDYRFVYMGPKGTWTPFHADVFMSYSWSANIYGRKKWWFFRPGDENFIKDDLGNLPYDVTNVAHSNYFEVVQNPGEVIFVPSGWHHQVWNLEDTISVNHNWINGCNIQMMLISMRDNLNLVRKEIDDCKDMENFEEHCQVMLNASFGMDYYKFYEFLSFIGIARIEMMTGKRSRVLFHGHQIGLNHILFDLKCVKSVLETFTKYDDVNILPYFTNNADVKPFSLLEQIVQILENS